MPISFRSIHCHIAPYFYWYYETEFPSLPGNDANARKSGHSKIYYNIAMVSSKQEPTDL